MTDRFAEAQRIILEQVEKSATPEDPSHARNTMDWITRLRPNADEILQLAGLAHDIHRSTADRLRREDFASYDAFLLAHASCSSQMAAEVARQVGYDDAEVERLRKIIRDGEFHSQDPDVQLLRDANSISIFDCNSRYYLSGKGEDWTRAKLEQNFDRASIVAREHIAHIVRERAELSALELDFRAT